MQRKSLRSRCLRTCIAPGGLALPVVAGIEVCYTGRNKEKPLGTAEGAPRYHEAMPRPGGDVTMPGAGMVTCERRLVKGGVFFGGAKEMLAEAIVVAAENMDRLYQLTGGVEQDGEKGAFREFFIAQLIRPLLPIQFGVGSGVVVASDKRQSRQTDVIIYDRRRIPPVLLAGDRGIFPIDSVLVVIEVKSILKACHYKEQLVDAARRFSPRTAENPDGLQIATPGTKNEAQTIYPLYAVFAYTSDSLGDEFERLQKQVPDGSAYVRLIGVLDKGVWSKNAGVQLSQEKGKNAVVFLVQLLNRIEAVANTRGEYRLQDWLA
jgi:hypothetical protein